MTKVGTWAFLHQFDYVYLIDVPNENETSNITNKITEIDENGQDTNIPGT